MKALTIPKDAVTIEFDSWKEYKTWYDQIPGYTLNLTVSANSRLVFIGSHAFLCVIRHSEEEKK
jgi:hypothetical protein